MSAPTQNETMRDELNKIQKHLDLASDHITKMMMASNDCLDLRNEKHILWDLEKALIEKYNEFATRNN